MFKKLENIYDCKEEEKKKNDLVNLIKNIVSLTLYRY